MHNPLRSDAARRRELLLDAARAVFNEHGVTAPLDLVVERAGLGRATLYRNFPDRAALMEALLLRSVDRIETRFQARRKGDADDFRVLLHILAERAVESAPLVDYWRTVDRDHPVIQAARARLVDLASEPLVRARDAGRCAASLQPSDLPLITGMLGAALRGRTGDERKRLAQRALALLIEGLIPGDAGNAAPAPKASP